MSVDTSGDQGKRLLVIFDGRCGFCNGSVRWLLKRDRNDRLRFVAFESPAVTALLKRHGLAEAGRTSTPGTFLAVRDPDGPAERVFDRSQAALAVLRELPGPWPQLAAILRWIPVPLRDLVYRFIARVRYRIGGRLESCPVPTPAERAHFL